MSMSKSVGIATVHALVGWGLCGATMFVGMALTTPARALAIHAVVAPFIFAAISYVYFRRSAAWPPLAAAGVFLGIVVAMDFFVVALFIEKSFEMFKSAEGTWLPFALIFASTWCTGLVMRRQGRQA